MGNNLLLAEELYSCRALSLTAEHHDLRDFSSKTAMSYCAICWTASNRKKSRYFISIRHYSPVLLSFSYMGHVAVRVCLAAELLSRSLLFAYVTLFEAGSLCYSKLPLEYGLVQSAEQSIWKFVTRIVVDGLSRIWGAGSRRVGWGGYTMGWGGYTMWVVREVRWVFNRRLKVSNVFHWKNVYWN